MAPKRKLKNENGAAAAAGERRVTRSSNRPDKAATADPEPPKKKKSKTTPVDAAEQKSGKPPPSLEADHPKAPAGASKTIIIEHCKQCNSFKTRALQVKNVLEKEVPGVSVLVNPEKPRRGCFEVREESGEIFVSLLDMKRPFKPMKDLDMGELVSDIVDKIK